MLAGPGLAAAGLGLPTIAAAQGGPYYGYGPGMMWEGGWFQMFFGFLMMLLFLALIVVLVVLGVRWLGGAEHSLFRPGAGSGQRTALDILKERLARGEIDLAEYEARKRALGE
jgi:putative membrane protein